MGQLVRIVVSCSDRKSTEVASDLRLAGYPDNLEERATRWIDRLNRPGGKIVPANQLYQGEHWSVVQQLTSTAAASGCQVELWVASAGYGLVKADDNLEPYAATFATRNADSITRPDGNSSPGADAAFWWRRLSERPRTEGRPSNLQELAEQQPESPMIVALSASYARAVGPDLIKAADALADQSQLFLVSSETAGSGLGQFRVPTSARFQQSLGGTRMSLNARVANHIVELAPEHDWDGKRLRLCLANELEALDECKRYDRVPLTDDQVLNIIRNSLATSGRLPQSRLLRQLRDDNYACEQKRFGRLYLEAVAVGVA